MGASNLTVSEFDNLEEGDIDELHEEMGFSMQLEDINFMKTSQCCL